MLSKLWKDEVALAKNEKRIPNLNNALWHQFGIRYAKANLYMIPYMASLLLQPYFLSFILEYVATKQIIVFGNPSLSPILVACMTGLLSLIGVVTSNRCYYIMNNCNIEVRSALTALLFEKCLKLSNASKAKYSSGNVHYNNS